MAKADNISTAWKILRCMSKVREPRASEPRLPTLVVQKGEVERKVTDSREKADLLRRKFFPAPPDTDLSNIVGTIYPTPYRMERITANEVREAIRCALSGKAPGPRRHTTRSAQENDQHRRLQSAMVASGHLQR